MMSDDRIETHRRWQQRLAAQALVAAAFIAILVAAVPPDRPAKWSDRAAAASVQLALDATRLKALFSAGAAQPAARLFDDALTLQLGGDEAPELVLVAYRILHGSIVARFESEPFRATAGGAVRANQSGALPAAGFYGGAEVGQDGIAVSPSVSAAAGVDDPVRFVVGSVAGKPADWPAREIIYLIAVPSNAALRSEARATPVVVFGEKVVELQNPSNGGGGAPRDAQEVMRRTVAAEQLCGGLVQDYTLYRIVEGFVIPEYYERDGAGPGCRRVPVTEYMDRWYEHAGRVPPRWTHEYADGLDMLGDGLKQGIQGEGVPGLGDAAKQMTDLMSEFVRAGADVDPTTLMQEDTRQQAADFAEFARRATIVGTEMVEGRRAYHVRAEQLQDIRLEQPTGGAHITLNAASVLADAEIFRLYGMRFEIEAEDQRKYWPLTIEMLLEDYMEFPAPMLSGGVGVMPTRTVMRISGLTEAMSEKDRRELQEAVAQVTKLRAEMESMPAAVRNMMRGQIERLERMTGDRGMSLAEATIDLLNATFNEGPPYPGGVGEFRIQDALFPAMVVADWVRKSADDPFLFVPRRLEFSGTSRGGTDGWMNVLIGTEDFDATNVFRATIRGGAAAPGQPEDPIEETGTVQIYPQSLTEVAGIVQSSSFSGIFRIGHMPCSDAPRAIETGLAGGNQSKGQDAATVEACRAEWKRRGQSGGR